MTSSADVEPSSFRQIIRSSTIFGSSSAVNVLVGIVRLKVAAVILGPAGIGLIGMLQNLLSASTAVASVGINVSGTRQMALANASGDVESHVAARRALRTLTIAFAGIGALAFWLMRNWLAVRVLGDASRAGEVGWLSLGVALGVATACQTALLLGFRRVGDSARVAVVSAVLSGAGGVGIILMFGQRGITAFILLVPLCTFLAGSFYVRRLPRALPRRPTLNTVFNHGRAIVSLGAAAMIGGAASLIAQLAVRVIVERNLTAIDLGHFQASWAISITYIGFVLSAMGADYSPRLSATIRDHLAANRLVNEQTEVALLFCGPVFLLTLGAAPWVLHVLYSNAFVDAAIILRWQILGDLLKVVSWPLGFLIIALGRSRTYILTEVSASGLFVLLAGVGIPLLGIEASGAAVFGMYAYYLPLVYLVARNATHFEFSYEVKHALFRLALTCAAVFTVSRFSDLAALALSIPLAAAATAVGWQRLKTSLLNFGPSNA